MEKRFTVPLNQIQMAPELLDTNVILFPPELMRRYRLAAGMDLFLHQPDQRHLLLTVGIPLSRDNQAAAVQLDPTYEFLYGFTGQEQVTFHKPAGPCRISSRKTVLLINREKALREVVEWLKTRPAVNTHAVYTLDGGLRCMFVTETPETTGNPAVMEAVVPVFDTYYVVEAFERCHEQWQEVQELSRRERQARANLIRLSVEIDRARRECQKRRQQLEPLCRQCQGEKRRFLALGVLEEIPLIEIQKRMRRLTKRLKELKPAGIQKYFPRQSAAMEEPPVVDELLPHLEEALEKADEVLNHPGTPESAFSEIKSARFTAQFSQPMLPVKHLEQYAQQLDERLTKIAGQEKELQHRLETFQKQGKELIRRTNNLTRQRKQLEQNVGEKANKLREQVQSLFETRLPRSNFLMQRLIEVKGLMEELLCTSDEERMQRLTTEIWQEWQGLQTGLYRLFQQQEERKPQRAGFRE